VTNPKSHHLPLYSSIDYLSEACKNNLFVKRNNSLSPLKTAKSDMIKKVIDYIENNYAKKVYIDEMAMLLGMIIPSNLMKNIN
jgi:hypothetical protein